MRLVQGVPSLLGAKSPSIFSCIVRVLLIIAVCLARVSGDMNKLERSPLTSKNSRGWHDLAPDNGGLLKDDVLFMLRKSKDIHWDS